MNIDVFYVEPLIPYDTYLQWHIHSEVIIKRENDVPSVNFFSLVIMQWKSKYQI